MRYLPDGKVLNIKNADLKRKDVCQKCSMVITSLEPNHKENCTNKCFCSYCNHHYCPALYHIHRKNCENHQIETRPVIQLPDDPFEVLQEADCQDDCQELGQHFIPSGDDSQNDDCDDRIPQDDSDEDYFLKERDYSQTKKRQNLRNQIKLLLEGLDDEDEHAEESESSMSLRSGSSVSSRNSRKEVFGFTEFADVLLDFALRLDTPNRTTILSKFGLLTSEGLDPKLRPRKKYEIIRELSRLETNLDNVKRQFNLNKQQGKILTDAKTHNSTYGQLKIPRKKEIAQFLIDNSQLQPGSRSTIMEPKANILDRELIEIVEDHAQLVWSERLKCEMYLATKRVADYDYKFLMEQIKEKFDVEISTYQFNSLLNQLFFYVEPCIGWHRKSFLVI